MRRNEEERMHHRQIETEVGNRGGDTEKKKFYKRRILGIVARTKRCRMIEMLRQKNNRKDNSNNKKTQKGTNGAKER